MYFLFWSFPFIFFCLPCPLLSPCSLTYFALLPICSHFPMPPTPISPKSVHPETGFTGRKEKALDKASVWDKALRRAVNGDWGTACGLRMLRRLLLCKPLGVSRLDSCIKPCDFKAFMADKDLLISNFLTNYNHKELRTIISEQNETAGVKQPLQVSLLRHCRQCAAGALLQQVNKNTPQNTNIHNGSHLLLFPVVGYAETLSCIQPINFWWC